MNSLIVEQKTKNLIMKEKWSADLFEALDDNFDIIIFEKRINMKSLTDELERELETMKRISDSKYHRAVVFTSAKS